MKYEMDSRKVEAEVQKSVQQMLDMAALSARSNQAAVTLVLHCNDTLRPINKLLEVTKNSDIKLIRDSIIDIKVAATRIANMSAKDESSQIEKEISNIKAIGAKLLNFRIMPWEGEVSEKALSRV
jgi:type II secretory pathway component HofQ